MADYYVVPKSALDATADAIKSKTGSTEEIEFTGDGFKDAVEAIPSGGGVGSHGLEVTEVSNYRISKATWHGELTDYTLGYFYYGASAPYAEVKFKDCGQSIGSFALSNAYLAISDISGFADVETIEERGLSFGNNTSMSVPMSLPKFTGKNRNGNISLNTFRGDGIIGTFLLPSLIAIPTYGWYGYKRTDIDITMGSVGNTVQSSGNQPFGSTASAAGTVTIYTTGALLDTIKTAVQNGAGSGLQFVYKAAENTTYGGSNYSAGDTILTVGGA